MGSTFSGESAFTYGRFLSTAGLNFDGECGHTVLGEQGLVFRECGQAKADMEPIFNLHQDHRFGLKSAIFERFGP